MEQKKEATRDNENVVWRWFVMRDLKRPNSKSPAYRYLADDGFEVFTPMKWKLITNRKDGSRTRVEVPFIQDLLFVHSQRQSLDPVVNRINTLQYRYVKGGKFQEPMVVRDDDMERFIKAVKVGDKPQYYSPEEITPDMCGKHIRIEGGPLDGCEGSLLEIRGSKNKRLLVSIPNLLTVAVEVSPEYISVEKGKSEPN